MDHFKLNSYEILDLGPTKILLLATGDRQYKQILVRSFPDQYLSRIFEDRYKRYQWGTYISKLDDNDKAAVDTLLRLLTKHVFIDDDLMECFALDYHSCGTSSWGSLRTDIGKLVYNAKPYHRAPTEGNHKAAELLATHLLSFLENHPAYQRCDIIVSTPPSDDNKPFDLPAVLVGHILIRTEDSMTDGSRWIVKSRTTRAMKQCESIDEKWENIHDAFTVADDAEFRGKSVLIIDDIYQSGFTINEVGQTLFEAGATEVFGLVATKTLRDMPY